MRFIALAVGLLALAPPATAVPRTTAFTSITGAFFAISVPNLAESSRWYVEKLGLSVSLEVPGTPAVTVLEGGGLVVELTHDPSARPGSNQPGQKYGLFKGGFLVKHFEATVETLRTRGVTFAYGPFPAHDKQRANVVIRDNAGNLIQIFGD
jgi:catechol 2,3-dioxygenase-like lactoylglutathione lyase family enzyme